MAKLRKGEGKYKDGYRFRYTLPSGERYAIYANTLAELREKEDLFLKTKKRPKKVALKDQIEYYLKTRSNIKKSTLDTYISWAAAIAEYEIMYEDIRNIRSSQIKIWLTQLCDEGYSQSTINGYYSALIKPAFQLAIDDEMLDHNPAGFKLATVVRKKAKREGRALSEEEERQLREFLNFSGEKSAKNNRDLFILIMETGLRAAEVCGLTVSDVDFEKGYISVNKQFVYRARSNYIEDLKSQSSNRIIPLSSEARECLKRAIENMPDIEYELDGHSGFIFRNRNGTPLTRNNLSHKYKWVADILGFENTTLHSLRHTFCTNQIRKGVPPKIVQYLMGHATISTTIDIYTHLENSELFQYFK